MTTYLCHRRKWLSSCVARCRILRGSGALHHCCFNYAYSNSFCLFRTASASLKCFQSRIAMIGSSESLQVTTLKMGRLPSSIADLYTALSSLVDQNWLFPSSLLILLQSNSYRSFKLIVSNVITGAEHRQTDWMEWMNGRFNFVNFILKILLISSWLI